LPYFGIVFCDMCRWHYYRMWS